MLDVNNSSFVLLAEPGAQTLAQGVAWNGAAYTLAGKQNWLLPARMTSAAALAALRATVPVVVDGFGGIARIAATGLTIESQDGANWVPLTDIDGNNLAPKVGRFVGMALGGARLALVASDGTSSFLELFDLRGRWGLDVPENPAVPVTLDPGNLAVALAVAADGPIYLVVQGGLAIFEGGPIEEFVAIDDIRFLPVAPNPDPLRQTALLASRPGGAAIAMAVDATRVAILSDQGSRGADTGSARSRQRGLDHGTGDRHRWHAVAVHDRCGAAGGWAGGADGAGCDPRRTGRLRRCHAEPAGERDAGAVPVSDAEPVGAAVCRDPGAGCAVPQCDRAALAAAFAVSSVSYRRRAWRVRSVEQRS